MTRRARPARAAAGSLAARRGAGGGGAVVPDSTVKPTEIALVKVEQRDVVDVSPDVVWILAVGSDARPGEDMTRTRGDALQLVGHEHPDRRRHGDRHPARLLRAHPRRTAATGSTPRCTTAARSCSARRSAT